MILKGNCLDILPALKDIKNPIIVTDPPFNIGYHYGTYVDKKNQDEYYKWLSDIFDRNMPFVVIHYPENLYQLSLQMGIVPYRVISWVYNSNTPRQHRDIAFFGVKPEFKQVIQPYKNPNDKRIKERIKRGIKGGGETL
jgi:hypothetical protein